MRAIDETMNESYAAVATSIPAARRAIGEFAADAGAAPEQIDAICLAASEAMTNAVVHAYRGGSGTVHVTAAMVSDELWVLVADDGCGMQVRSDSPGLGLGLGLISQECDDFTILAKGSGGTEVRMRFDLVGVTPRGDRHGLGSEASAALPASSRFSTTT
jgi:anti-sigma regulatory factor (Ser/Thr protein kinase)